eukprot:TRINITY_DN17697_c0_g1_i1.p1 TRINITY_DN17697_c0_g1~~TRINITY_DN17697_c0_g1_i1.p1  ORF type:complete len:264 (-),score=6.94 TRINITY_DN17697_c0_g1_i1:136-927(-)
MDILATQYAINLAILFLQIYKGYHTAILPFGILRNNILGFSNSFGLLILINFFCYCYNFKELNKSYHLMALLSGILFILSNIFVDLHMINENKEDKLLWMYMSFDILLIVVIILLFGYIFHHRSELVFDRERNYNIFIRIFLSLEIMASVLGILFSIYLYLTKISTFYFLFHSLFFYIGMIFLTTTPIHFIYDNTFNLIEIKILTMMLLYSQSFFSIGEISYHKTIFAISYNSNKLIYITQLAIDVLIATIPPLCSVLFLYVT